MDLAKAGEWAFIACVLIAVIAGIAAPGEGMVAIALVVLGLIVGLLNISEKETTPFLVAAIALIVAGTAGFSLIPEIGAMVANIVGNIAVFVAPAAVIVALKAVWTMAKK